MSYIKHMAFAVKSVDETLNRYQTLARRRLGRARGRRGKGAYESGDI